MIQILQNGSLLCSLPSVNAADSVMHLLHDCGLVLDAPCGGQGVCGKCRIRLSGDVSAPDGKEQALLTPDEISSGVRLACRAHITGTDAQILLPRTGILSGVLECISDGFPLHPLGSMLGLAVDIGTTTVAVYLYDLSSGTRLGATLQENPQRAFGADVTTRLSYSINGGAEALRSCICACIQSLADTLCADCSRSTSEIDAAVLTGNTAMLYFLTARDAHDLAVSPFQAATLFGEFLPAVDLGLRFSGNCRAYLPRCISAYVGADVACAIVASGLMKMKGTAMLADIGTNGEIVLCSHARLLCCSAAAGPAFEGAGLSCGSAAIPGAVDAVWSECGAQSYHALPGHAPASICGSGALDLLACLLESGRIDHSGRLDASEMDGLPAYALTEAIRLTQKDVRALQLAKAAIGASMETLLHHAGTEIGADALLLAGGFGNRLRVESALRIGLLPAWSRGRTHPVGNAAGLGAIRLLLDETAIERCNAAAAAAQTVDLATDPFFSKEFIACLAFDDVID